MKLNNVELKYYDGSRSYSPDIMSRKILTAVCMNDLQELEKLFSNPTEAEKIESYLFDSGILINRNKSLLSALQFLLPECAKDSEKCTDFPIDEVAKKLQERYSDSSFPFVKFLNEFCDRDPNNPIVLMLHPNDYLNVIDHRLKQPDRNNAFDKEIDGVDPSFNRLSPLQIAMQQGNLEIAEFLLKKGASPTYIMPRFYLVHDKKDIARLQALGCELAADWKPHDYSDTLRFNPLTEAMYSLYMLRHGPQNEDAAEEEKKWLKAIDLMLELGVDTNHLNKNSPTAQHKANLVYKTNNKSPNGVLSFNLLCDENETAASVAAALGLHDVLQTLEKRGVNITQNPTSRQQMSPLEYAVCFAADPTTIRMLCEKSECIETQTFERAHSEIKKLLLEFKEKIPANTLVKYGAGLPNNEVLDYALKRSDCKAAELPISEMMLGDDSLSYSPISVDSLRNLISHGLDMETYILSEGATLPMKSSRTPEVAAARLELCRFILDYVSEKHGHIGFTMLDKRNKSGKLIHTPDNNYPEFSALLQQKQAERDNMLTEAARIALCEYTKTGMTEEIVRGAFPGSSEQNPNAPGLAEYGKYIRIAKNKTNGDAETFLGWMEREEEERKAKAQEGKGGIGQ